ncbi:MAG: FKBP-type peptidyl-prolyl cis-trans isomerase [Bacteroidota bacterium]
MKKSIYSILLLSFLAFSTSAQITDSLSYAMGLTYGKNMKAKGVENINGAQLGKGFEDALNGKALMDAEEAQRLVQTYIIKQKEKVTAMMQEEGKAFLAKNGERPEVKTTASGLQYEILTEGTGPIPTKSDKVVAHYEGKLLDGTKFDSSFDRGEPATFPVGGLIPGWVEALQLMPTGSKWRLYIPSDLAYGPRGAGAVIPPHSTLIFDLELIEIK